MAPSRPVLILAVDHAQSLDVLGPVEVFHTAQRLRPDGGTRAGGHARLPCASSAGQGCAVGTLELGAVRWAYRDEGHGRPRGAVAVPATSANGRPGPGHLPVGGFGHRLP